MEVEKKLQEMGIILQKVPQPIASYVPAVVSGTYVFVSGQVPFVEGKLKYKGKIGEDISVDQGYDCARIAALNGLAAARSVLGSLDKVKRIVKVTGFVRNCPGFEDQAKIVNGASDLLLKIFGEAGRHARLAMGTSELPLGAPVEVEMIMEIEP